MALSVELELRLGKGIDRAVELIQQAGIARVGCPGQGHHWADHLRRGSWQRQVFAQARAFLSEVEEVLDGRGIQVKEVEIVASLSSVG